MTSKERTAAIREKIIKAAQKLFFSRGFADVTVSDIARDAGVSRVTLFKYFGSKDELAAESINLVFTDSIKSFDALLADPELTFKQKFDEMLKMKTSRRRELSDGLLQGVNWSDPRLSEIFGKSMKAYSLKKYGEMIDMGAAEGDINPAYPKKAIMDYFDFFFDFFASPNTLTQSADYHLALIDMFCYGILKRD